MYSAVAVYTLQGGFVGYTIHNPGAIKLQSTNLYNEDEQEQLAKRLAALNESSQIKAQWPDAKDPEVQALVDDPTFEPIEYKDDQVLDEDNSYLVYIKVPVIDEMTGEQTNEYIDGPELDREASVLKWVTKKVPVRPSDWYERVKKAQEVVAKRRLV